MKTKETTVIKKRKTVVRKKKTNTTKTTGQKGSAHHKAKLTPAAVKDIRKQLTVLELAKKYNVSTKLIYDVRNNRLWKNVTV